MPKVTRKWSLEDLVDLEAQLRAGDGTAQQRENYDQAVGAVSKWPKAEKLRRKLGMRLWLEAGREDGLEGPGRNVVGGVQISAICLGVVGLLIGIGVIRGLVDSSVFLRGVNVWLFLMVTLGVQWVILVLGFLGFAFLRRQTGALSLMQRLSSWFARRLVGKMESGLWKDLISGGARYRSPLAWRFARLTQGVGVMFNLGLVLGFVGCLFFWGVSFYWDSTFEKGETGLVSFMQAMAVLWSWTGMASPPLAEETGYDILAQVFTESEGVKKIWPFLLMALSVYGLLPRLLLWWICGLRERRALAALSFQAPQHRDLWRRLNRVRKVVPSKGQEDGVVVLDVGGAEVAEDSLRRFLLQELRVNPEVTYTAGVLRGNGEKEALDAIRNAKLGVVFLVEGWSLAPKQLNVLHRQVREVGGEDLPIHMLILGELSKGVPAAPSDEEWEQAKTYVDSLQDPATEVVAFGMSGKGGKS